MKLKLSINLDDATGGEERVLQLVEFVRILNVVASTIEAHNWSAPNEHGYSVITGLGSGVVRNADGQMVGRYQIQQEDDEEETS